MNRSSKVWKCWHITLVTIIVITMSLSTSSLGSTTDNSFLAKEKIKFEDDCKTHLDESFEEDMNYSNTINQEFDTLVAHWGGKYANYYAGSYISNRQFTILVTCDPEEVQNEIWRVTKDYNISVKKAKYSYDYLCDIQNQITELITDLQSENNDVAKDVIGIGVDEIENEVFVEVLYLNDTKREEMESILEPFQEIHLISKDRPYQETTRKVTAGTDRWVYNSNLGGYSTIGFCATRVNSSGVTEKGFVTAGHSGNNTNTMKISGTNVGKVSWRKYGGNCDALFVNMNSYPSSDFVRSNILSTNYTIASTSSVGVVGSAYALHGKSSGIISGTVNNKSFSFTMNGHSFTDHIRMNMSVVTGDSGGPLVKTISGNVKSIVGICSSGDGTYSNFSKVTNILNQMNGSLYT